MPTAGFEPATYALRGHCTTTVLSRHMKIIAYYLSNSIKSSICLSFSLDCFVLGSIIDREVFNLSIPMYSFILFIQRFTLDYLPRFKKNANNSGPYFDIHQFN